MIKHFFIALCGSMLATLASAQGVEATIKKNIEATLPDGTKVEGVRKLGVLGLYEAQVGGDLLYTDEKATHVVVGQIIEPKTQKNLTQERLDKLAQIKFADLPTDIAIKQVKGNGKRIIATFEDPNCGYCKKLAKELQAVNDITIYTFLHPILSPDSLDKSKAIWCATDRAKAWNDYMVNNKAPDAGKCDTAGLDKSMALARKLNIRGTPAIFLADGTRIPGYMPAAKLEEAMARAAGH
ncbi:MAG: DsbC family protein [Rhodocyclaceae bacterium]|nr:DsbC family protein [Rhodocyclaceae bacterium]